MPLPVEIARQLTEEQIAFVKRSGLKAEVLEPGFVRLRMPLQGNQNHIGSMYAGALFTLAEIPGGALFLTSFDAQRFYPVIKEMNLRFRRPATADIQVEARLSPEAIADLEEQASQAGDDAPALFDATATLMLGELRHLVADLIAALGGETEA